MSTRLRAGAAVSVAVTALLAAGPAHAQPGDTPLFADDFESGSLSPNWTVSTGGLGTATIEDSIGYNGSKALRIVVPNYTSESIAYVKHTLTSPVNGIAAAGRFKITAAGCDANAGYSGGSVPLLRFFDTSGHRVAGLYRINGSCSKTAKLYVQHSDNFYRTGKNLSLQTWYQVELRISVSTPSQSLVQVFLNGALVYGTEIADNGAKPIASVNLHNEHRNQVGTLVADDILISGFPVTPPSDPCDALTPAPVTNDPGQTVLADNFERYGFPAWSDIARDGDATVTVGTAPVHSGRCAALLHVTANAGSRGNLVRSMPAGTTGVWVDGWFQVMRPGSNASSNVPILRLFSGGNRVLDVYRVNGSGQAYLRLPNGTGGYSYVALGRILATNTWYHVKVHAVGSGTAQAWINEALVYSSSTVPYGTATFDSVMVGAEHFAQEGDSAVDDIVIKAEQ